MSNQLDITIYGLDKQPLDKSTKVYKESLELCRSFVGKLNENYVKSLRVDLVDLHEDIDSDIYPDLKLDLKLKCTVNDSVYLIGTKKF